MNISRIQRVLWRIGLHRAIVDISRDSDRMGNLDKKIKDEVGAMHLGALQNESWLWLGILQEDPPSRWTRATLDDMEFSLKEIRRVLGAPNLDDAKQKESRARLSDYCIRMRRNHGGASAQEIHLRRKGRSA
jgi:hypothetical protein